MLTILVLIGILTIGYMSAHFILGRLRTRFFFISGMEYLLLGLLVGPDVGQIMTPMIVNQLGPVMSLSIGSLGLLYGLQLRFSAFHSTDGEPLRVAFIGVLLMILLVGGGFLLLFLFTPFFVGTWDAFGPAALMLGTTAALSAPSAIAAVQVRYKASGPMATMLRQVGRFTQVLCIVAFGLIFCIFHEGATLGIRSLTSVEWIAVNLGFGLLLGGLFFLFLGREESEDRLLVALIGIVVFSSGAAHYLNLSPLFVNLILGLMLANTSSLRGVMLEILHRIEKPVYVLLLVFAGAAWNLGHILNGGLWYVFAGGAGLYFILRLSGKQASGYVAFKTSNTPEIYSSRIGQGLVAQGAVAAAMVVNYAQVYQNVYTDFVVTCVLFSVLVSEFISPLLTRNLLLDAQQIALKPTI